MEEPGNAMSVYMGATAPIPDAERDGCDTRGCSAGDAYAKPMLASHRLKLPRPCQHCEKPQQPLRVVSRGRSYGQSTCLPRPPRQLLALWAGPEWSRAIWRTHLGKQTSSCPRWRPPVIL
jgi:hypothetical protein